MSTTREQYERQLCWRMKQVSIGKATDSYQQYSISVPIRNRRMEDPHTPDPYDARMSKRQFEGRIKAWKRSLQDTFPGEAFGGAPNAATTAPRLYFFVKKSEKDIHSSLQMCGKLVTIVDR